ncbi:MAG TPA: glycosyltransferase family 4 protein [Thermoflexia bacterium]|nr:glycosyltransferase family 4 protein [Thermoflexia bacterium]
MAQNSSRRVLMIAPTSFFLDYGCHVRILEEARALLAEGVSVRIVTYYLGDDWPGLDIVRSRPTPWHADYEVGSSRHKITFDVLLGSRALRTALNWRPHLIHGHLHEGALIGAPIARLLRIPLVFDFQGSLTAEMVAHHFIKPTGVAHHWWRQLERRITQLPEAIVTSTVHSTELLARTFGREEQVYPLPDCVNLDFFSEDSLTVSERSAMRAALGVSPGRKLVVYLGLLADYQGIPQLLGAAAYLRQRDYPVSFLIMGFPGEAEYQARAAKLGLTSTDVIFTGRLPYAEAPRYLSLGDIAVAPKISATEGSGKILNYMAMKLPVVTYDTPVSHEYLGRWGIYAKPVGEAQSLAQALAFVIRNPEVARIMGVEAHARATRHFSWQRTGRRLLQIYDKLW